MVQVQIIKVSHPITPTLNSPTPSSGTRFGPGTLAGPCRVFVPCARARPGQGQAPRCRSLGLAGSRFFFLRGRAVTDNKSDDLVACARFERWSFFCSRVNNHRFLLFECLVCCVLLCLGVPCRLFPHTKPKNKTRCLLQWRPRGRRSRTWRGCWAPVGLNWNPLHRLAGLLLTLCLQAPPVSPSWLSSIPYVLPTTCDSRTPM